MEIDEVIQNTEMSSKTTDSLKKEINLIENAITEKKRQVIDFCQKNFIIFKF